MAPFTELDCTPENVYLREAYMDDYEEPDEITIGECTTPNSKN